MKDFNFVDSQSPEVIEELYERYQQDPESVGESWKSFFQGFEYGSLPDNVPVSRYLDVSDAYQAPEKKVAGTKPFADVRQSTLWSWIAAYRKFGHLYANVNPLAKKDQDRSILDPQKYHLDLDTEIDFGIDDFEAKTVKELQEFLEATYCASIGCEYQYISDEKLVSWLENRIEQNGNRLKLVEEDKKAILTDLLRAEGFEAFLNTKYVGKKRFSLEGGTSLIPALESLLDYGGSLGVKDAVIGMAHRGRLNVLVNVLRKPYSAIFNEFEGSFLPSSISGDGDVKYHLGFSSDRETPSGNQVHLSLCPNPSHLEFINPVLEGVARCKQDRLHNADRSKVLPIAIHGDAAFAGQGVVYETVNMSQLEGFTTGGTIHIIINNQVGFTTNPKDSRSTLYCSDLMKMLEVPIFHVNGDDPEAVVQTMHLALDVRQKFGIDVVIDLICYRRYGHNESDEPRFTQPQMYKLVDKQDSPGTKYASQLIDERVLSDSEYKKMQEDFKQNLDTSLDEVRDEKPDMEVQYLQDHWKNIKVPEEKDIFKTIKTGVSKKTLQSLAQALVHVPDDFTPVKRLQRLLKDRAAMAEGKKPMDWGMVENLCYASLLQEGVPVRLTGQDVRRGTFSHRHAVWTDDQTGKRWVPMNEISQDQQKLYIYDSHLSETGVLGFEFGYSMANPQCLILWEAQFGDFANGGQVIIDQFIASSQSKWQRMSGLVMLLPHGYEGQGPEHSSARLERFLQACAENNIQVANLTTPAQLFHVLRRQVLRDFRIPLVIMSPKSLLRHPKVVSSFEELEKQSFAEILDDEHVKPSRVERLVFCSGKIYYDLLAAREEDKNDKVALVRIEQLYPLNGERLKEILANYGANIEKVWVQEEPENMGAWYYIRDRFLKMGYEIRHIARKESASPATGSEKKHLAEQQKIMDEVWKGLT